jgi:hypothetical protein
VRHERVVAVQDRVRPPTQQPDEELRVIGIADEVAVAVEQQRPSEEGKREQ